MRRERKKAQTGSMPGRRHGPASAPVTCAVRYTDLLTQLARRSG